VEPEVPAIVEAVFAAEEVRDEAVEEAECVRVEAREERRSSAFWRVDLALGSVILGAGDWAVLRFYSRDLGIKGVGSC